ncbi:putative zinc finger protein At1g68190 [Andrographis paniculata]|uniref:putative zinc finger protein At1g68190 n=1 Tax=Andrographis paniculata TaxID=175694 RepID=UPI0021E712B9|nr:putative zinc finger protein At1g68190 [Andrographis paniculata]XP_051145240.1 putative zinc finger protein At1g68190 [Andrographis paniculata]XP_051145241.1 putative zinc finger protein At1g68190 [Andrographis paniculata]XP_051145243.1 putative zinc finger protein At1g68190 [Andrographis paniculata]
MERRCEFCTSLCSIVYCKADAAHLCLSCDSKVHSANALSYRHPRTLVCESCRYYPALIRCFDHAMFMCQSCDTNHHVAFQHQKRVISCYVGCPSAKDLAALWGLDCNKLDRKSLASGAPNSSISSNQEISYLILQQIQDLEKLQLSEGINSSSCSVHVKERTIGLPFRQKTLNTSPMEQFNGQIDFQNSDNVIEVKAEEPLSSPFSQLDSLQGGDSYWQCKSPLHNNEIWLQNMQDLGVCDEVKWMDDGNIPDVDLTFRNFEELFGSEHEPGRGMVDDINTKVPGPSPVRVEKVSAEPDGMQTSNYPMRACYSTSSFSVSRMTGESSGSEYKDDGVSPTFPTQQQRNYPHDSDNANKGSVNVVMRCKEKKVLRHERQGMMHNRFPRSKSDIKKRGRGQALKAESSATARSF